jgi:hypothetical protein
MNKKAAEQVAKYFADVAAVEATPTPTAEYDDESGDVTIAADADVEAAGDAAALLDENVEGEPGPNAANAESLGPE